MNISEPFIKRPVMTSLVMAGVFIFGIVAFKNLPVSDLPSIEFPTILVTAQNPGMDPVTMANNVATPLEQQMMAIPGLNVVISQSSLGNTQIVLNFDLTRSLDGAAADVLQAINAASGNLPPEMPSPPTYKKVNPADTPVIYVAVSSETMTLEELYDYANTAIAQRFSTVAGAARVEVYGSKRALRLKIDPDKLAAMNLGIDRVTEAIVNANQSLPTGTVYNQNLAYTLISLGQIERAEDYDNIIVAERDEKPVYFSQIGRGETSTQDEDYYLNYWESESGKKPTIVIGVTKLSGYNTVTLCKDIVNLLKGMRQEIPPSIDTIVMYNQADIIKASIWDVEFTLILAFCLVVFVIFLFLGKLSTTVIPCLALPLAIVGTFGLMYVIGYSLDILSLLGLILVVGFLVDDAIVVLENIVRHVERFGKSSFDAALDGSQQISSTVLSMTLSLASVFIPLIFLPGLLGRVFHEFGMVVVIAVLFSGFISLTFTPLLCSRFLQKKKGESRMEKRSRRGMEWLLNKYEPALAWVLRHRLIPFIAVAFSVVAAGLLFRSIPEDFLPPGDTGAIQGVAIADQGASLFAMRDNMEAIVEVAKKNSAVQSILAVANIPEFTLSNQGILFFVLADSKKRPPIEQVTQELEEAFRNLIGMSVYIYPIPEINLNIGTGIQRANYTYVLSTIEDPQNLYQAAQKLTQELQQQQSVFEDVSSNIQLENPQVTVNILRDQASLYGISVKDIEKAFQLGYSGGRVSTLKTPINIYNVIVQMEDKDRKNPDALEKIYLTPDPRQTKGQSQAMTTSYHPLVPLQTVAEWKETVGPLAVFHHDQFTSADIYFNVAQGAALSTAIQKIQNIAETILPSDIMRTLQGQAKAFQETIIQMVPLLAIGILVVYLLLGSLYESFVHPLTILSTLPGAIFGGLLMLFLFQMTLSLYSYVGMIVLIGIVMKNGIMLVEFANENVKKGQAPYDAIIEAAKVRFRPILMTTVAAAMGAVPLALGMGTDASSRRPLGLVILGGLLFAQFITYFFTPVVYLFIEEMKERMRWQSKS